MTKVCREVDDFFLDLASKMPSNKNVQLGGRDGFKFFKHGVTSYMLPKVRRINGGWWISIARQLKIFFCVTKIVSDATRTKFCEALSLLFEVHHGLRNPLHKDDLDSYRNVTPLSTIGQDIGHTRDRCLVPYMICYLMCVMLCVPNKCFVNCRSLDAVLMRRA
jgi:hypothetical protein